MVFAWDKAAEKLSSILVVFLMAEAYAVAFVGIGPVLVQLPALLLTSQLQNRHCETQACCVTATARRRHIQRQI